MTADAGTALMQSDCVGLLALMPHIQRSWLSQPLSPPPPGPLDQVQHCHAGDGEDDDLFDEDEPAHGQQLLPIVSTTPNTVEPLVPMPPAAASPPPARNRTVRSKLDPDQP